MAYTLIFLLKKCEYSHFFSKNICELDIVLSRTVNILTTKAKKKKLVNFQALFSKNSCVRAAFYIYFLAGYILGHLGLLNKMAVVKNGSI